MTNITYYTGSIHTKVMFRPKSLLLWSVEDRVIVPVYVKSRAIMYLK